MNLDQNFLDSLLRGRKIIAEQTEFEGQRELLRRMDDEIDKERQIEFSEFDPFAAPKEDVEYSLIEFTPIPAMFDRRYWDYMYGHQWYPYIDWRNMKYPADS